MPNLKAKYIIDENGDRVAPITYIDAVRNSSGDSLSDLMVPENLGFGIGTCSTSSGTALTVALQGYKLVKNGYVTITFENDVPASSTLNINSQGAKAIYYKGAAIDSGVIKADDTITFCYDGTNYEVISLGGGGSAAGLEIVEASGTTLNAEVGKYYRYDSDVSTLAVTLPTITGATEVQEIVINLKTATNFQYITFSGGTIKKIGDFYIKPNSLYEIKIKWNGSAYILETNNSLPYDSAIEYIATSGTQYIDSGVAFTAESNSGVEMKFSVSGTADCIFGCSRGEGNYFVRLGGNMYIGSGAVFNPGIAANTVYEVSYITGTNNAVTQKVNGVSTSSTYSGSIISNTNVGLFEQLTTGNTPWGRKTSGKIYSCRIYNGGSIIRDLIPVRIGTTGYLYDRVTGSLLDNSGTGSFTLGPDV